MIFFLGVIWIMTMDVPSFVKYMCTQKQKYTPKNKNKNFNLYEN